MNDVDDESVCRSPHGHWTGADEERDYMKEIRQMPSHVQRVVKGEHEEVPRQNRDIVPHEMLLECWSGRRSSFVNHLTGKKKKKNS